MFNDSISKGQFVIANPMVNDHDFSRTVILICEHSNYGSVGFIINKPMPNKVSDFIPSLQCDFKVYDGGPVEKHNLYFVHSRPDLISNSIKINENLYWSGEYDDLKKALAYGLIQEEEIRFYLGYAGWAKNQLKDEINGKNWTAFSNNINIFQNWNENFWKEQMKNISKESLFWINLPKNPSLN